MRETFTSGSVGRAPGNRCLYPEASRAMRNIHKTGKVPHDSRTTKVERSQSFYVDSGGKIG
jgi:hypothetical protein